MANKMIIDASHPEETRVVVLRGNRVEEFDFESASKKPLRGNIYLAKVTRVEPSLQAAFVDYGGNRHGFLAFSEIHPDYYQIPVADRQALLDEEARQHREEDEEPSNERRSRRHRRNRSPEAEMRAGNGETVSQPAPVEDFGAPQPYGDEPRETAHAEHSENDEPALRHEASEPAAGTPVAEHSDAVEPAHLAEHAEAPAHDEPVAHHAAEVETTEAHAAEAHEPSEHDAEAHASDDHAAYHAETAHESEPREAAHDDHEDDDEPEVTTLGGSGSEDHPPARSARKRGDDEGEPVEVLGGDEIDEAPRRAPRLRRHYKIQEVIKRRQVLLVQVVKEERGNKGAALTTYLSLAGRYSVLMPNTARGGGISRKITNAQDRSRLKAIAEELEVPEGMGVILRTAGAARTKPEVKRDFEYLLRMWETVRETTLASSAPTLVYEEGSLIKRAIRDLFSKDVEEIVVAGEAGYREAKSFMRLLMPNHVKSVVPYRESQPVFAKAGVEAQLDAMFSNQVTLKSGGYIVINQTEALVAIDVNSGRSTREHNIEDTALRTNLEAADEVARQLRLRDLAGLIVVDFIDMEEARNNRAVERRMKDALKNDRARIQVGRISHFGLLEMSRQRIRTGVLEGSTVQCAHCMGAGVVRSTSSVALHVLRVLEDALIKSSANDMVVRTRTTVALYILNQKRAHLRDLERRFGVAIMVEADDTLTGANYHSLERGEPASGIRAPDSELEHKPAGYGSAPEDDEDFATEEVIEAEDESENVEAEGSEDEGEGEGDGEGEGPRGEAETAEESERRRRRRRRRRRGGAERAPSETPLSADAPQPADDGLAAVAEIGGDFAAPVPGAEGEDGPRGSRRRRSRRGRRGERDRFSQPMNVLADGTEEPAGEFEPETEAFDPESQPPAPEPGLAPVEADAPYVVLSPEPATTHEHVATAHEPVAVAPAPVYVAPEPVAHAPAPVMEAAPQPDPAPEPEPEPAADEPPRPRRTGWWSRARASIVGE